MLPKKLDEEVAASHLGALDIKLTKLSPNSPSTLESPWTVPTSPTTTATSRPLCLHFILFPDIQPNCSTRRLQHKTQNICNWVVMSSPCPKTVHSTLRE